MECSRTSRLRQAGLVDTGTELLNNPVGTLAGYIVQSNYNKNFPGYAGLTGEFGSTGIFVNQQQDPAVRLSP